MIHMKLDYHFNFQTNSFTLTIICVTLIGENSSYIQHHLHFLVQHKSYKSFTSQTL